MFFVKAHAYEFNKALTISIKHWCLTHIVVHVNMWLVEECFFFLFRWYNFLNLLKEQPEVQEHIETYRFDACVLDR